MKKVCKIRFYPTKSQINLINETLGCCRYIQNKYIEYNIESYKNDKKFVSGYDFSKYINKLKKSYSGYDWVNKYSSKAIKDAIMTEEKAFKKFFKEKNGFPKFKSRKRLNKESFFFVKDNIKFDINRYIIKIPILGKIRILQKEYLPDIEIITSGRVIKDRNKYYVSFIYEYYPSKIKHNKVYTGIDLGIKNYASIYLSDETRFIIRHYKDYRKYKNIKNKIKYLQKIISFKQEINYYKLINCYIYNHKGEEPNDILKNIMKGESYKSSRIRGLKKKISRLYEKLNNIKTDFIYKLVNAIVTRIKPQSITIEDLKVSDMLKNDESHKLHELLQESCLYRFREILTNKCKEFNIELRIANKYFASSKICSNCGYKNKNLKLSDRIFKCHNCGYEDDRDMNAAINLCNLNNNFEVII